MNIQVEFYGIPRHHAGESRVVIDSAAPRMRLADVLAELARRYPALADACFEGDGLRRGYTANVDGERFVNDPQATLPAGSCLLIMSADAGG